MSGNQAIPLISVVFTLHDQRVDAGACVRSWAGEQTLARDRYEVIVATDGASPALDADAAAGLGPGDRLLTLPRASMMALYHHGAEAARGALLLFTEFHCIARPDCLDRVLRYMTDSDLDGACLHSAGDDSNVFSRVERALFERCFETWRQPGDWRKVLVRGFVIRREAYFASGGFDPRFAYFSDWALAAELHARGYRLGYVADASLLHHYNTGYAQFVPAVRARAIEECEYRLGKPAEFCEHYFGSPLEWQRRFWSGARFSRLASVALARSIGRTLARPARWRRLPALVGAWFSGAPRALWGLRGELAGARVAMAWGRVLCVLAGWSERLLARAYLLAFRQIDLYHRLRFVAKLEPPSGALEPAGELAMGDVDEARLLGFYGRERWRGRAFRWTGPVAAVRTAVPPGSWEFELEALDVRGPVSNILCDVFIDGRPVEGLRFGEGGLTVSGRFESYGAGDIVLTCAPIPPWRRDRAERRPLGIPVSAVRLRPA